MGSMQLYCDDVSSNQSRWSLQFLFYKIVWKDANKRKRGQIWIVYDVGPILTEFRIDQMAFGQPECTFLNIQNVPLL